MHGRLVDNSSSLLLKRSVQWTSSLVTIFYCALNLQLRHYISLSLSLQSFMTLIVSDIDVDLVCGVWISSTSYSGFCPNLVQLIAWAEDTYIGLTLRFLIVSSTPSSLFSPSDENVQLETLGEEFELAGKYLMERIYQTLSFGTSRCIGIVRTMTIFAHLICLRICVVRCFGIVRTIPTSSSSWSTDHLSGLRLGILSSSETTLLVAYEDDIVSVRLWSSLTRTTLSFHDFILHCGLPITVVERLQRYNCIWLTYIVNVEQNILFPIEVWS